MRYMERNELLEFQLKQLGRMIQLKKRPNVKLCFYVIFSDGPCINLIDSLLKVKMSDDVREFLLATRKTL